MTKRIRPVQTVGTVGAMALMALVFQACGGGNSSPMTGTGGTSSSGSAGTSGAGTAGTSGAGTAGTTGAGGAVGSGGNANLPSCVGMVTVSSNMEPAKGIPCDPAMDINVCTRTCGPEKKGTKQEMCTSALSYQEMSGCTFDPAVDYSCYKIPTVANTACPAGVTPQGSADCSTTGVAACTVCNSTGGLDGGQYLDSTGAAKPGFCVCQMPDANGARKWSCASNNGSWPCPLGLGC